MIFKVEQKKNVFENELNPSNSRFITGFGLTYQQGQAQVQTLQQYRLPIDLFVLGTWFLFGLSC